MTDRTFNDNDGVRHIGALREPDAHGQAALLLVESLMHGLIERRVIDVDDAIEIVAVAAEVKEAVAADWGDTPETMHRSLALLGSIGASLRSENPAAG